VGNRLSVRLFGRIEVAAEGAPLVLPAGKPRLVLAVLALRAGCTVSSSELIDRIWEDEPPGAAGATLRSHVKRLRRSLRGIGSDTCLGSDDGGYRLTVDPDDVDVHRFRTLRRSAPHGNEAARLAEARACFRGPLVGGAAAHGWFGNVADSLEEERLQVVERIAELDIARDRPDLAAAELSPLVVDHPLRESLWHKLMLALHRSGRDADALRCYARVRRLLTDEVGIEPSEPLRALQAGILRGDGVDHPSLPATVRKVS
jgi:DNA-binding SARP family transcriptional activator